MAKQNQSFFSKYGGIILSIILFVILTVAILAVNYYLTNQNAKKAQLVNIVAQQEVLTKDMGQEVMNIDLLVSELSSEYIFLTDDIINAANSLKEKREQFEQNLNILQNGGGTDDNAGMSVNVDKVANPEALKLINETNNIWGRYARLIDTFQSDVEGRSISADTIRFTTDYTRTFNQSLFDKQVQLENVLQEDVDQGISLVQLVSIGGLIAALSLFAITGFTALRQLFRSDAETEKARKDTSDILATVNEGLFLVSDDLTIGDQYSDQLEPIIGQSDIRGRNLNDLLESLISAKDQEAVRGYIGQLFNPKVKAKLITDLNPLERIEVRVDDPTGKQKLINDARILSFKFSRVYEGKKISRVLSSVSDITEQVLLEQRLEAERAQSDKETEMLTKVLHADEDMMSSFLRKAKMSAENINSVLMRPEQREADLQRKAKEIYREIHSLKGEASALQLEGYVGLTERFEDKIETLQGQKVLTGNDFLPLTVELEELITMTNQIDNMHGKIAGGNMRATPIAEQSFASAATEMSAQQELATAAAQLDPLHATTMDAQPAQAAAPSGKLSQFFNSYAQDVATRQGKQVAVISDGLDEIAMSIEKKDRIKDIITQLTRNSLVHGIETPAEREANGKMPTGHISIQLTQQPDSNLQLTFEDDGNGINYQSIRERAVALGKYTAQEVSSIPERDLLKLIFASGFSTAGRNDQDAGRGVGLDVIRERVKEIGGKLFVSSEEGTFTRFTIRFPA